ncbi:hypothetical protein K1T71_013736 [Dendrolimus kikuchii]|uniref:Uncharacterized protein n=1 Tax=Dendrolimus kikuchii TaxID=765133 RepID=A0ACC1CHP5_9NEOP|nr:hypothetical protein K1T71_013736 [Dendrolimus kikuchii]
MSGGRLLVLDRQGRAVKHFPLPEGVATLGQDIECDIRILQPAVNQHHASIVIFNKHALVHAVGESETLVNGQRVSKAVLGHNDVITVGGRSLRWEYTDPALKKGVQFVSQHSIGRGGRNMRRRTVAPETSLRDRALRLAMEISRTSIPGTVEKQVAIVQPQRRDTSEQADKTTPRPNTGNKRPRNTTNQMETTTNDSEADRSKRKSAKISPKNTLPSLQNTTKASLWIESRKTSPRKSTKANTSVQVYTKSKIAQKDASRGSTVQGHLSRRSIQSRTGRENTLQADTSQENTALVGDTSHENSALGDTSQDNSALGETSQENSVQVGRGREKSALARTSPRKSVRVQTPAQIRIANVRRMFSSAKKSTPLRMAVLRKAQSAQKVKVTKIQAPSKIDHTKQAALLLMTGHTPKSKVSPNTKRPSYVVKKPSPVRKTPASGRRSSARRSKENNTPKSIVITPRRASTYESSSSNKTVRSAGRKSVTILEITDSEADNSTQQSVRRSGQRSLLKSPLLPTPKKSALKDPKRNTRKSESIKFDLSHLENQETLDPSNQTYDTGDSASDTEMILHYSEVTSSPSPRRPIHSRSSKILEKTLGTTVTLSPPLDSATKTRSLTPDSPSSRKSLRGSLILQKALESPTTESSYSRRTTRTISETNRSEASAFKTHTLSPRTTRNNIESYSIVDLVSVDSNDTLKSTSLYNSVGSSDSTAFETPQHSVGRKTRSTIDNNFLGSSTPYVDTVTKAHKRGISKSYRSSLRSQSSPNISQASKKSILTTRSTLSTRRSKSLTTPENTHNTIALNTTRISRRARSRSRINDSDLLLIDGEDSDFSPKTSRRITKSSQNLATSLTDISKSSLQNEGTITPEDRYSPHDVGTPVLSIQTLLNSSQGSLTYQNSHKKSRRSYNRKTIGVLSENRKRQSDYRSRSLNISAKKTILRLSKDSSDDSVITDEGSQQPDNEEVITPKSAVKLVPEAVKNKHSTAKKPQSKRSIIDDLNESDIVKQLFNSPVKRKLSQSMTEFSRKRLFEEDDDVIIAKKPTRNTIALPNRTPDNSVLDHTEAYTPDRFVSPISTPSNSPNLSGINRLFKKNTPENDLRDVRGVKGLLRTPRRSARNDLTNLSGVKSVFARSPTDSLNDVKVKNVFAKSPENDLRRVSGVKSLFQRQISAKNDLTDVRGVKKIFVKNSPANDLRNVSGIKRLQRKSPKNDLTDVRGVRKMFKQGKKSASFNVSGVEELFNTSNPHRDTDILFDQLLGKPPVRAVYSNTFSTKAKHKMKRRQTKSLHSSIDVITNNVEEWLQNELQKRLNKETPKTSTSNSLARELNRIATDTVEGNTPIRNSRVRDATLIRTITGEMERKKSASEIYSARKLPIKKRSIIGNSLEESNNGNKSKLPIKKRLLPHSTPMKSWNSLTLNASELGRMSPIAFVDKTREADNPKPARSTKKQKTPHSKIANKTIQKSVRVNAAVEEPKLPSKLSIPKTRAAEKNSPKSINTRNHQNTKGKNLYNTKKRQKSLIITKKVPGMSPTSKEEKSLDKETSRLQQAAKIQTPKTTRAKVHKGNVVVSKPSPKLKPGSLKNVQKDISKVRITRARKTLVNQSPKELEKISIRVNKLNIKGSTSLKEENAENKLVNGGHKTVNDQIKEIEVNGRARIVINKQENIQLKVTRQTRRTKANSTVNSIKNLSARPITRKGKAIQTKTQEVSEQKNRKLQEISGPIQHKNRKGTSRTAEAENQTKNKTIPRQVQSEAKTRNQRNKDLIEPNDIEVKDDVKSKRSTRLQKAKTDEVKTESKRSNRRNKNTTEPDNTELHDNATTKRPKRLQKTISNELETKLEPKTRSRRNKEAMEPNKTVVNDKGKSKRQTRFEKAISDEPITEAKTRNRRNKDTVEVENAVVKVNTKSKRTQKAVLDDKKTNLEAQTKQLDVGDSKGRKRKNETEEIFPPKVTRTKIKTVEVTENLATNVSSKRIAAKNAKNEDSKTKTAAVTGRSRRVAATATASTQETNKRKRKSKDMSSAQDTSKEPTSKRTRNNAQAAGSTPLKTRSRRARETNERQVSSDAVRRTRRR